MTNRPFDWAVAIGLLIAVFTLITAFLLFVNLEWPFIATICIILAFFFAWMIMVILFPNSDNQPRYF